MATRPDRARERVRETLKPKAKAKYAPKRSLPREPGKPSPGGIRHHGPSPAYPPGHPLHRPSRLSRGVSPTKGHRGGGRSRSPYSKPHAGGPFRRRPRTAAEGAVVTGSSNTGSSNPTTGTGSSPQKSQAGGNLSKGFGDK